MPSCDREGKRPRGGRASEVVARAAWRAPMLALVAGVAFGVAPLSAAAGAAPDDAASSAELLPLKALDTVTVRSLDVEALLAEDRATDKLGVAPRFAVPHPVSVTLDDMGVWEKLDRSTSVWRLRVTSAEARSINLGFSTFWLPEGARLTLLNGEGKPAVRPFTDADNKPHGELWTPVVEGETVIIEVAAPNAVRDEVQLEIGSINVGYRGFYETAAIADRSGACNVDVVCSEGDGWEDEISSVAVISTGGSTFCTGFMVNNVRQDQTPYFITAFHCGVRASDAPSLVTYWNYENSTCRPPGSSASGGAGDGVLTQFNTGSTLRAEFSSSDVTLVELDNNPDPTWEIGFSGWDNRFYEPPGATGIHHPRTEEKRISFEFDQTASTIGLTSSPEVPVEQSTHVKVRDWDVGTTEPGSSGSPLYDTATKRVIGQLHGGGAACGNDLYDGYGRIARSWDNGSPGNSLNVWLDPDNTGAEFVDTLSGKGATVAPGEPNLSIGVFGGPFTNANEMYTYTNNTPGPVNYGIELSSVQTPFLTLNGGVSPVSGTLAPTGGSTMAAVAIDAGAASLPAGVYTQDVIFDDQTNGRTTTITWTLEIGQTLVSVTPAEGLVTGGPIGGPFPGAIDYIVTSERPTPVDIEVTADQPWIAVSTTPGGSSFTLNGTGDSATISVSIDAAAAAGLPAGIVTGSVEIANLTSGDVETRPITLDVGRFTFAASGLPAPINDNSTTTSTITVGPDFCIGDLDVEMDISHTYIGDLRIILSAPDGTTVTLHDRSGGSSDDIVTTYDDDGGTPADGPGSLADFEETRSAGVWTLSITDNANADQGALNAWTLKVASAGADCPQRVVLVEETFDTDPGWTAEGQWQFGTPTGGSGSSGGPDPTSGFTGPNVYGYNLAGGYSNNMPKRSLTSASFDLSTAENARLQFRRWLGTESSTFDDAGIEISVDGGATWSTIWEHSGGSFTDGTWILAQYDISAIADGQPDVRFRWYQGSTDGSVTYCGWNLDDVAITVTTPAGCAEDITGDGIVDVIDLNRLLAAFNEPASEDPDADINGDGTIDVIDLNALLSLFNSPCP